MTARNIVEAESAKQFMRRRLIGVNWRFYGSEGADYFYEIPNTDVRFAVVERESGWLVKWKPSQLKMKPGFEDDHTEGWVVIKRLSPRLSNEEARKSAKVVAKLYYARQRGLAEAETPKQFMARRELEAVKSWKWCGRTDYGYGTSVNRYQRFQNGSHQRMSIRNQAHQWEIDCGIPGYSNVLETVLWLPLTTPWKEVTARAKAAANSYYAGRKRRPRGML